MDKLEEKPALEKCGIVMPISATDGCDESHWTDVLGILKDAIVDAGFEANLVSAANDVGVIQKRIVQNLYANPVAVVDISGRNANVMFELGMRLAFDKPTIVVKDDQTPYSFDTSPLEHLTYPRDLRFGTISKFKKSLSEKIKSSIASNGQSSFLKSFGDFKVAEIDVAQVPIDSIILDEIQELKKQLISLRQQVSVESSQVRRSYSRGRPLIKEQRIPLVLDVISESEELEGYIQELRRTAGVLEVHKVREGGEKYLNVVIDLHKIPNPNGFFSKVQSFVDGIIPF